MVANLTQEQPIHTRLVDITSKNKHKDSPHDGNWLYQIRLWQRRICPLASAKSVITSPWVYVKLSALWEQKVSTIDFDKPNASSSHRNFPGPLLRLPSALCLLHRAWHAHGLQDYSPSVGSVYTHFCVLPGVICPNSS